MERYTIRDDFLNHINQSTILEVLQYKLANSEPGIEIDLENVKHMDSIGISVFIILFRKATLLNKKIRIINTTDKITEIFHMTRLHTLFDIQEKEHN